MNPTLPEFVAATPLDKCYRLINHGPTVLVSSAHNGVENVMAAAWSMGLDFKPPKVAVVIDKATRTRELVEASGLFALNIASRGQAQLTLGMGNVSAKTNPQKLPEHHVRTFTPEGSAVPLVQGAIGWLVCKILPEPRNHEVYDLFIGEVTHAFADTRVYQNGHWQFDQAPDDLRTLHYVAGGQFFVIGESLNIAQ